MPLKCFFCGGVDVIRRGKLENRAGTKQRYGCKTCGKRFVKDDGFKKMRHRPSVIARAIHMHQDGMSFFTVQNHLWQHDNTRVSRQTLWKWEKKYSNFLKSAAARSKARNKRPRAHG